MARGNPPVNQKPIDLPDFGYDHEGQPFDLPSIGLPAEILFHPELADKTKLLFGIINNLAKSKYGCYAKNSYLANCLNCSKQTITNGVGDLKRWGFLRIENPETNRRIYITDIYPFLYRDMVAIKHEFFHGRISEKRHNRHISKLIGGISELIGGYKDIYTLTNSILNSIDNIKENPQKKPSKKSNPPRKKDFDLFRQAYPKHKRVSLKKDLSTWRTNIKDIPPIDILMGALENAKQNEDWTKDNGKYIPLFTTFINQNRWEGFLDDSQLQFPTSDNEKPREVFKEDEPELFDALCNMHDLNLHEVEDPVLHFLPLIPIAEGLLEHSIDPREMVKWRKGKHTGSGHLKRMVPGGDLWDEFMEWREDE